MKMLKRNISIAGALLLLLAVTSCKKTEDQFSEPYPVSTNGLGIKIDRVSPPIPSLGAPGETVTVSVEGLLPYKDKLTFMFNGEKAEVLELTSSYIKVKVPDFASTGVLSVLVDDVVTFGPTFKVNGLINPDPTFKLPAGTNGPVMKVLSRPDGKYMIVGAFTNYNNKGLIKPINRIVSAFNDFSYDPSLLSGKGANGYLNNIIHYNGKYMIAGGFSGYNQRSENISNVTILNTNGSIDTMGVHTFRRPDQTDTIKYFPRFNGGADRAINNLYKQDDDKIVATGDFQYYISRRYDQPNRRQEKDSVILDSIRMPQILRMNSDGTLDKTFRFNTAINEGLVGANGPIATIIHEDGINKGKILVYGKFTTFDGKTAKNILRLNADGSIDESFNTGLGADNGVYSATYNKTTDRYMITGAFKNYNGKKCEYLAMLKPDGTLDETFVPRAFSDAGVRFAKQLNDGLIVVSGFFKTYDNIARNNFMIINSQGGLAPGYNSTGEFSGALVDVIETQSDDNKRALLLIGNFDRFNNEIVKNIIRVVLQ